MGGVTGPNGVKDIGSPPISLSHTGSLLSPLSSFPSPCPSLLPGTFLAKELDAEDPLPHPTCSVQSRLLCATVPAHCVLQPHPDKDGGQLQ